MVDIIYPKIKASLAISSDVNKKNPNRSQCDIVVQGQYRCCPRAIDDISVKDILLYESDNFIVLNKPPDIRMNGEFDVTVEKLVMSYKREVKASELKWIHQLDFATSGVLCVGLNTKAGSIGSLAFQNRLVRKKYVAVVFGHISKRNWKFKSDPIDDKINHVMESTFNHVVKKSSVDPNKRTWQDVVKEESLRHHFDLLNIMKMKFCQIINQKDSNHLNTNSDQDSIHSNKDLFERAYEEFEKCRKLRKRLRKLIKFVMNNHSMDINNLDSLKTKTTSKQSSSVEADVISTAAMQGNVNDHLNTNEFESHDDQRSKENSYYGLYNETSAKEILKLNAECDLEHASKDVSAIKFSCNLISFHITCAVCCYAIDYNCHYCSVN